MNDKKMKKSIYFTIVVILLVLILGSALFIFPKINKSYPEENFYCYEESEAYCDEGLYYMKDHTLRFLDNQSGTSGYVCDKPNCEHNSESCNAYFPGDVTQIMVYGTQVILSSFDVTYTYEGDETVSDAYSKLEIMDRNGGSRKTIYSADDGSVLSMIAIDGILYFTAYTFQNGFEVNTYFNDCVLYSYDLRWGKLRELVSYKASEDYYLGSLSVIQSDAKDAVYLQYAYYGRNDRDEKRNILIEKYNIDSGQVSKLRNMQDVFIHVLAVDEGYYMVYQEVSRDESGDESQTIVECDSDFNEIKEVVNVSDGWTDFFDGYMYIIYSDYKKLLYDCREDKWFVANTSFADTGTYISDVLDVDRQNDLVYIDATDYTGYQPGDALPGDISNKRAVNWSDFLADNFIEYDQLDDHEKEQLDWFDLNLEK